MFERGRQALLRDFAARETRLGRFKPLHDLPCRLHALRPSARYLAAAAAGVAAALNFFLTQDAATNWVKQA
jgi:hypothetical protein